MAPVPLLDKRFVAAGRWPSSNPRLDTLEKAETQISKNLQADTPQSFVYVARQSSVMGWGVPQSWLAPLPWGKGLMPQPVVQAPAHWQAPAQVLHWYSSVSKADTHAVSARLTRMLMACP